MCSRLRQPFACDWYLQYLADVAQNPHPQRLVTDTAATPFLPGPFAPSPHGLAEPLALLPVGDRSYGTPA